MPVQAYPAPPVSVSAHLPFGAGAGEAAGAAGAAATDPPVVLMLGMAAPVEVVTVAGEPLVQLYCCTTWRGPEVAGAGLAVFSAEIGAPVFWPLLWGALCPPAASLRFTQAFSASAPAWLAPASGRNGPLFSET